MLVTISINFGEKSTAEKWQTMSNYIKAIKNPVEYGAIVDKGRWRSRMRWTDQVLTVPNGINDYNVQH